MWAMVEETVRDAVRRGPLVAAGGTDITRRVEDGSLSALEGAAEILSLFAADLPHHGWQARQA
jgi:hypothetical protein